MDNDPAKRFEEAVRRLMRALAGNEPLSNLSLVQLRLLRSLFEGPKTAGELCRVLETTPSALSQLLGRLAVSGLVARTTDAMDHRVRRISLSEAGQEMMASRHAGRLRRAGELLSRFTSERQESLLNELEAVLSSDELAKSGRGVAARSAEAGLAI